jgi:hypothetical protein
VHGAVVNDDEETFHKRTADPVPNQIFISKDQNGLNPLHKVTIKYNIYAVFLRSIKQHNDSSIPSRKI